MREGDGAVVGWDIGGVNVKAALLDSSVGEAGDVRAAVQPFEVWRAPDDLGRVVREVAVGLGITGREPAAVTMTAELSDAFRTKREGVTRIIRSLVTAFPRARLSVLANDGDFVDAAEALERPRDFAATNWVASALYVAARAPACILVDVGSTTTDIVPVAGGRILAEGRSDAQRLSRGELVYTGALRTNPDTFADRVPLRGRMCRVAAEWFTQTADVYLVLGRISQDDYVCPTPDGRAATPSAARERIARLVCEDAESLTSAEIDALAQHLAGLQLRQVQDALAEVLSGLPPDLSRPPVLAAGVGAFIAEAAARRIGLPLLEGIADWHGFDAVALPAAAAAALLATRHRSAR